MGAISHPRYILIVNGEVDPLPFGGLFDHRPPVGPLWRTLCREVEE